MSSSFRVVYMFGTIYSLTMPWGGTTVGNGSLDRYGRRHMPGSWSRWMDHDESLYWNFDDD